MHCDHVVQVTADLSVWLDSTNYNVLGILKRKCVHLLPAVFFQFYLEERSGMDVQTMHDISGTVEDRGYVTI